MATARLLGVFASVRWDQFGCQDTRGLFGKEALAVAWLVPLQASHWEEGPWDRWGSGTTLVLPTRFRCWG